MGETSFPKMLRPNATVLTYLELKFLNINIRFRKVSFPHLRLLWSIWQPIPTNTVRIAIGGPSTTTVVRAIFLMIELLYGLCPLGYSPDMVRQIVAASDEESEFLKSEIVESRRRHENPDQDNLNQ